MVSRSKHSRATVCGAFRAVSQKLFNFCELSRSCIDRDIRPAPLATAPNISAIFAPDEEDKLDGKNEQRPGPRVRCGVDVERMIKIQDARLKKGWAELSRESGLAFCKAA